MPACLEDYVEAENPVRVVEVFVDGLDLGELGFVGVDPAATGRPARLAKLRASSDAPAGAARPRTASRAARKRIPAR